MKRAVIIVAEGCEELEAVTVIDVLRRGGIVVDVAGLTAGSVTASRGVVLVPDVVLSDVADRLYDLVVLPGGASGTDRLAQSATVAELVRRQLDSGRDVGAICAAPKVLRNFGLLAARTVTSYPGAIPEEDPDYTYSAAPVVVDGHLITSRGPGTALDFALALLERLAGAEVRARVEAGLVRA